MQLIDLNISIENNNNDAFCTYDLSLFTYAYNYKYFTMNKTLNWYICITCRKLSDMSKTLMFMYNYMSESKLFTIKSLEKVKKKNLFHQMCYRYLLKFMRQYYNGLNVTVSNNFDHLLTYLCLKCHMLLTTGTSTTWRYENCCSVINCCFNTLWFYIV